MLFDLVVFTTSHHSISHSPIANAMPASACSIAANVVKLGFITFHPAPTVYRLGHSPSAKGLPAGPFPKLALLACPTLALCRQVCAHFPVLASSPGASVYMILATDTAIRPMLFDLAVFTTSQHNISNSPSANAIPASACFLAGTCIKSRCISPYYISHRYRHKTNVN
jgi:hypothetical protein